MAKKYFWLKLKDDFFNQKEIKMLRKIAGGDTYTVIYLKLLLLSLKNEGKVYFDGIANNFIEEIALDIDEDEENVQVTMNYLDQKGLIEFNDTDEFYLSNIASMIGSETESARRVRKHRRKKALQSNDEVTDKKRISNGEIEKELEIDKELETETDKEQENQSVIGCYSFFEQNGFGMISPNIREQINQYLDDFIQNGSTQQQADELIIEALKTSDNNGVHHWRYVNSILNDWYQKGYKTVDDVKTNDKKQSKPQSSNDLESLFEEANKGE